MGKLIIKNQSEHFSDIEILEMEFDRIIEFKQTDTKLLECFFFKGSEIVFSKFLTLTELNNIKKTN
tara:strand:- start:181 stop:378 length:198 start_codon:yes stop_codon:yes gene_type:complete